MHFVDFTKRESLLACVVIVDLFLVDSTTDRKAAAVSRSSHYCRSRAAVRCKACRHCRGRRDAQTQHWCDTAAVDGLAVPLTRQWRVSCTSSVPLAPHSTNSVWLCVVMWLCGCVVCCDCGVL